MGPIGMRRPGELGADRHLRRWLLRLLRWLVGLVWSGMVHRWSLVVWCRRRRGMWFGPWGSGLGQGIGPAVRVSTGLKPGG